MLQTVYSKEFYIQLVCKKRLTNQFQIKFALVILIERHKSIGVIFVLLLLNVNNILIKKDI
jgi:hypothetical protein